MEISIIVPVYKVEQYLSRCIDSILAQSFSDFSLILVDDGSPDTCPQICDSYAVRDVRATVIHKRNGGLSDARNAGIDWAIAHNDSEWLAFVDSDDYLHPDYLRILYETATRESADLAICDFVRVNDREEVLEEEHSFFDLVTEDKQELFEYMRQNWRIVTAWNKLYKKTIFADLRFPVGKIHEDSFTIHHVLWNCHRAAFIPDGLYYYRQRNNSIMSTETPKSKLDGLEAFVEQQEFIQSHNIMQHDTSLPISYLSEFTELKKKFEKQQTARYKQLKKRLGKVVFSRPKSRTPKRLFSFYCTGLYCKAAAHVKKSM